MTEDSTAPTELKIRCLLMVKKKKRLNKLLRVFFTYSEFADTVQFRTGGSLKKCFGFVFFFPAVRFEPGTAGYEARTLPLCYAVPPKLLRVTLILRT